MSIRKIKRRAMARLSEPRVELKVGGSLLEALAAMKTIEREQFVRAAVKQYIKDRTTPIALRSMR